jgi:hypothetical protein
MYKVLRWLIILALAGVLSGAMIGCAMARPPELLQEAIATMNSAMPRYVAASNAALEKTGSLDAERVAGIGTLVGAVLASALRSRLD